MHDFVIEDQLKVETLGGGGDVQFDGLVFVGVEIDDFILLGGFLLALFLVLGADVQGVVGRDGGLVGDFFYQDWRHHDGQKSSLFFCDLVAFVGDIEVHHQTGTH